MTTPSAAALARHWSLDPEVTHLNHGSFGACPRVVLDHQRELRERLERDPMHFMVRELERLMDAARSELAGFVGADPDGLVAVSNVTQAVNAVLRSLPIAEGDELLVTDHEYNACRNVLEFVAKRAGARVIEVSLPFPLDDPTAVQEAILSRVSPRTKLALVDHVTSPTGLVLPIGSIVSALRERGVDTFVDGAHAPGMLPLNVSEIGAAWYAGNCHKWLCSPKGAGFLVTRADRRETVRPASISHGANTIRTDRSRYQIEFGWKGSEDPTAFLCVPASLRALESMLEGGWPALRQRNHETALAARRVLTERLRIELPAPESMIGSLGSLRLPEAQEPEYAPPIPHPLQEELYRRYRIEVPVLSWPRPPQRLLRISAQLYNGPEDYLRLASALAELLER